jgi:hypothetical protein
MNASFNKIIFSSVLLFVCIPSFVFAQSPQPQTQAPPRAITIDQTTLQPVPVQINTNNQAGNSLYGSNQSAGMSLDASQTAATMGTCLGTSGVTNFIKTSIAGLVGSIVTLEVPTADNSLRGKEVGTLGTAYISWDSLGYCAINSIIEALGAATVAWINSGFQGNPVFVDNPTQFFADIADIEAGGFLNEISNGFLCSPIRNIVRLNLANQYNNQIGMQGQCTFTSVSGNMEQFLSGDTFSWADWISYTQTPYNNPFGATIYGSIELDQRIAQSLGVQSTLLDWGRGFLSFKDPETGKISSPGAVIEGQINQRLFNGESRLNIADEFDEIVNALVNQLIKVAINEVTQ